MAQKVLLTGISGFIGGHIALQLFQRGYHVVGAVRDEEDIGFVRGYLRPHIDGSELAEKLTFVVADLLKRDDWRAAMEGCHAVIHTASPIPNIMPNDEDLIIRPAVDGTRNVLRAASSAGISRV
ncbi:MAG: NAD-dependent epimerase/dehydratase family protein, partial [Pseudomonadota bacterium]